MDRDTKDKARHVLLLPHPPVQPLPIPADCIARAGFEAVLDATVCSITGQQLTSLPVTRLGAVRAYSGREHVRNGAVRVLVQYLCLRCPATGENLCAKVCGLLLMLLDPFAWPDETRWLQVDEERFPAGRAHFVSRLSYLVVAHMRRVADFGRNIVHVPDDSDDTEAQAFVLVPPPAAPNRGEKHKPE